VASQLWNFAATDAPSHSVSHTVLKQRCFVSKKLNSRLRYPLWHRMASCPAQAVAAVADTRLSFASSGGPMRKSVEAGQAELGPLPSFMQGQVVTPSHVACRTSNAQVFCSGCLDARMPGCLGVTEFSTVQNANASLSRIHLTIKKGDKPPVSLCKLSIFARTLNIVLPSRKLRVATAQVHQNYGSVFGCRMILCLRSQPTSTVSRLWELQWALLDP